MPGPGNWHGVLLVLIHYIHYINQAETAPEDNGKLL